MLYEIVNGAIGFLAAIIVFTLYCQYNARINVAKLEVENNFLYGKVRYFEKKYEDTNIELNYFKKHCEEVLKELYCKDRILELNGIPIECCDENKEKVEKGVDDES